MHQFQVPPKSHHFPSKDHAFRVAFSAPLSKRPPRLSREGYIRALEVYGREDILLDCLKSAVDHFNEWRKRNPGDLNLYRQHANSLGYDWEKGTVTEDGIYTSNVLPTTTELSFSPAQEIQPINQYSPGLLRDINQFIHTDDIDQTAGEEHMVREANGRFAAMNQQQAQTPTRSRALRNRNVDFQTPGTSTDSPIILRDLPAVLQGAPGNLRFIPGEDHKNAHGAAGLLNIVTTTLRSIADDPDGITDNDLSDIRGMLRYLGTQEDIAKYEKSFRTQEIPAGQSRFAVYSQTTPTQQTQRTLFPQASGSRKSSLGSSRKRNRFMEELEEEADDPRAWTSLGTRREEDKPYICNDQWGNGTARVEFSTLYVGKEAIPTLNEEVAQQLGKFHEAVIAETESAISLTQSMGMLGISSGAILQLVPKVPVVVEQNPVKEALEIVRNTPQLSSVRAVKQFLLEAGRKYTTAGWSPITALMPEIISPATTSRQSATTVLQDNLLLNGRAAFNAPVETVIDGIPKISVPVANIGERPSTA
ncbi:hypothetical protein GGI43DRAFT_429600 [Trichoderma evansii]